MDDRYTDRPDVLLSVVMPCYNERRTIREIIRRVQAVPLQKEIIVVDDASSDGSGRILDELARQFAELTVLHHAENRGKGASLRSAFSRVRGEIVVVQDADLEYDPAEYPKLIQPILDGKADVVYGSRFSGWPRRVLFFWHTVGNHLLTLFSNVVTNLNLTDMETGYKAFRSQILRSITLRSNRFGFEPEFTQKIARLGCRVYEVPISYAGRGYAEGKKIGWKDGLAAAWTILRHALFEDEPPSGHAYQTLARLRRADRYNAWIYETLQPFLGEKILEIGAGTGNVTRFLAGGATVRASEICEDYHAILEECFRFHSNVTLDRIDLTSADSSRLKSEGFDSIVLLNVLEHIEDDALALRNVRDMMGPQTNFLLLVPAHGWLFGTLDRHLGHIRRYRKGSLRTLLESGGFEVLRLSHFNPLGILGWFLNSKILRRTILPRRQLRAFNAIVPLARLVDLLPWRCGLSLIAVCRSRCGEDRAAYLPTR